MAASKAAGVVKGKPVIIFHGDKGGVGKSWTCQVFTDWMVKNGMAVVVVDGDTRNPDVSRMFADSITVCQANLRVHDGWMDLFDFMSAHPDKAVVISMPAGIGGEFKGVASRFTEMVKLLNRPLMMFWVLNRLPDSVNLLTEALQVLGDSLDQKIVVKNLFFGDEKKFTRWDTSNVRDTFERSGGKTVLLTELNERAVDKLFADNDNIMPFSMAAVPVNEAGKSPHKLTPSENMELIVWLQENHKMFDGLRQALGLPEAAGN